MPSKVKVYGKTQKRTALGIANAYLVLHPDATLDELNQAFPKSLNSTNRCDTIFVDSADAEKFKDGLGNSTYESLFFEKDDELLTLSSGQKVAMLESWRKEDFDKIAEHAKQYNIEVVDCQPSEGFKKGEFTLEYEEDEVPPVPAKKKCKWWWWLILLIIIIILIILLLRGCCRESAQQPQPEPAAIADTTVVDSTAVADTLANIQTQYNAAQYKAAQAVLDDAAKGVLQELAQTLKNHPTVKVKIVGHSSSDGIEAFNQKLSEQRAKVAADYLLSLGIEPDRVLTEGKGSSEPIDTDYKNRDKNRRTEFVIIK